MSTLLISVDAQAFIPETRIFVNREVAVIRVLNTTYLPITCSGIAYGRTRSGVVLNAWMIQTYIYPNSYAEIYIHSNIYDPMAQAWTQIDCLQ